MRPFKEILLFIVWASLFMWLFLAPLVSPRFKVCSYMTDHETTFVKPIDQCIKERKDEACVKGFANSTYCDGGVWIGK